MRQLLPRFTRITKTAAQSAAPTFTWRPSVTDERTGLAVAATLLVDDRPCTGTSCQVPSDGQPHLLQVRAAGYQDWELGIRARLAPGRVFSGPVRLRATKKRGV
ncbi:hypothetical protein F8S13_22345 [Chloroflexia bacterium SDU3-3]|nr:hypothetical protein F8S13_22345 [Chloroflexia bacterium SDU3-3]